MLQDIIIVWFLTMGVFAITKNQMPFAFWQKIACDKNLELRSILFEPLTECLCCMSSLWTCIWFGYSNLQFFFCLPFIAACLISIFILSCYFGRGKHSDFAAKSVYFFLILWFILYLPSKNLECLMCIISVAGINYHLIRVIGNCRE